jgi:DNA-binding transcriptional LysR family regulator
MLDLRSTNEMPVRLLRLGVTELSALTWLPRLITAIRQRYPTVAIEPEVDMTRTLHERLLDDSIDLVVAPATFSAPDITAVPLAEVQNVWMARPGLVGARARSLSLDELAQYPIIAQGRKSGSGVFLNTWFKARGIAFSKVLTSDSLTAVVGLAVAGLGVAYLPELCFRPLVKARKLEVVRTKPPLPAVQYAAMYRSDRPSPFISAVVELAREVSDFTRQLQR